MSEPGKKPTRKTRKTDTPEVPADAIERRAYEKFAARGFAHGADFDDWRQAEEELAAEIAPRQKRAAKGTAQPAAEPAAPKRAAKGTAKGTAKTPAKATARRAPKKA